MKILHCCLSSFYNENYNYQENLLPRQNKQDGHEVQILASTEVFKDNKYLDYTDPKTYINGDGIKVIRVPYKRIVNDKISHKFRAYIGVTSILEEFAPDVILFHGMSAWELITIAAYTKKNQVKLYLDNHACVLNSGRNWFSKRVLHGLIYRYALRKALPVTEKILCIGMDEYDFAKSIYKVPENMLELWPLGGNIQSDEEYNQIRRQYRMHLQISDDTIVFVHSGKMDMLKKTCELLRAFSRVKDEKFVLLIAGEFLKDIEKTAKELMEQDSRVRYLGWKSGSELMNLLIAADVYLQPGSMSATMQNAMCCRCAVVVQPTEMYQYLLQDTGIYAQTEDEMERFLRNLSKDKAQVKKMKEQHLERAKEALDYKKLAARIYN